MKCATCCGNSAIQIRFAIEDIDRHPQAVASAPPCVSPKRQRSVLKVVHLVHTERGGDCNHGGQENAASQHGRKRGDDFWAVVKLFISDKRVT